MHNISRFQYITQEVAVFSQAALVEEACKGGVDWVQLRLKNKEFQDWKNIALEVQDVCKKYGAKLIINDNVILAKEINADGVHLGKEDMSPSEARKILGEKFIIGGTANTLADVEWLAENKVDYIGLGPFRFTATKEKLSPVLDLDGYRDILDAMNRISMKIPVIAIGGITPEDVEEILSTGIYGIAVSSAINLAEDKIKAAEAFKKILQSVQTA